MDDDSYRHPHESRPVHVDDRMEALRREAKITRAIESVNELKEHPLV